MEFTNNQLKYIREEKELDVLLIPSLDEVIVEFLKKFEVFVKPISSGKRNIGESAMSGAIGGMLGADVGGDAFMISGQKKQTAVQEWTQWKQWTLDHKDFESFRSEKIDKVKAHNEKILSDPKIQKDLENLFKEPEPIEYESDDKIINFIAVMAIIIGLVTIPFFMKMGDNKNDSSFNSPIIKTKILKTFISL